MRIDTPYLKYVYPVAGGKLEKGRRIGFALLKSGPRLRIKTQGLLSAERQHGRSHLRVRIYHMDRAGVMLERQSAYLFF